MSIQLYHQPETNIEVYIDTQTGETYQSIKSLARLLGVHPRSIQRKLDDKIAQSDGRAQRGDKIAEILTAGGLQRGAQLLNEPTIMEIAEYYAFDAGRYRTEAAKQFYRLIAQAGLRAYHYTVAGYQFNVQPRVRARDVANYLPARKQCMDKLRDHGAIGQTYAAVEAYNNALNAIEKGTRDNITSDQALGLVINYQAATIELLEREQGFAKHQSHLANTAKRAMRHQKYAISGEESVPNELKPKKELKQLKAS